jgi:hypothetical protein
LLISFNGKYHICTTSAFTFSWKFTFSGFIIQLKPFLQVSKIRGILLKNFFQSAFISGSIWFILICFYFSKNKLNMNWLIHKSLYHIFILYIYTYIYIYILHNDSDSSFELFFLKLIKFSILGFSSNIPAMYLLNKPELKEWLQFITSAIFVSHIAIQLTSSISFSLFLLLSRFVFKSTRNTTKRCICYIAFQRPAQCFWSIHKR